MVNMLPPPGNKALLSDYENHWFPLIRPCLLGAGYFLGGFHVALGGLGPLDSHVNITSEI